MTRHNGTPPNGIPSGEVPYSQQAEQAVLGGILHDPRLFIDVMAILKGAGAFFLVRHRYIFDAMTAVHERGDTVDILTVSLELVARAQLDDVGGDLYLAQLMAACPSVDHVEQYAREVVRHAYSRALLVAGDAIKAAAADKSLSPEQKRSAAEAALETADSLSGDAEGLAMRVIVQEFLDGIESTVGLKDAITGLATGFTHYDELLDGFQAESLNIIAARPAMGKTSLLIAIALHVAKNGGAVYFWSGEMSRSQIVTRMMSVETGIEGWRIRRGLRPNGLKESQWRELVQRAGKVGYLPIVIDDQPNVTPALLEARAKRVSRRHPLRLVIVDYIGLIDPGVKKQNRDNELGYISRHLKGLAMDLKHCPVVTAAQLSRACETRQDKRPQLSDLRDSGNLEQDADTVTFIYRDVVYNQNTEHPNRADLILAKNRHGATGVTPLHFERGLTKFSDARIETIDLRPLGYDGGHDDEN